MSGKPENLIDDLQTAIRKSNETNRQKSLENLNNRQAIALLRTLVVKGMSQPEMDYNLIPKDL